MHLLSNEVKHLNDNPPESFTAFYSVFQRLYRVNVFELPIGFFFKCMYLSLPFYYRLKEVSHK